MRRSIRDAVRLASITFCPVGPVVEIGSAYLPEWHAVSDLRTLFPGRPYVGCDLRQMAGVDCVCDGRNLPIRDRSAGTVVALEVLEHVPQPHLVVSEAVRVLAPGGLFIMSVPFAYRLHGMPHDYWRFTSSGIATLLADFAQVSICAIGPLVKPSTIFAVASQEQSEAALRALDQFESSMTQHFSSTRVRGFGSQLKERLKDLGGLLAGRSQLGVRFTRSGSSTRTLHEERSRW